MFFLSCLAVSILYKDPAGSSLQGRIALNLNEGYMYDRVFAGTVAKTGKNLVVANFCQLLLAKTVQNW